MDIATLHGIPLYDGGRLMVSRGQVCNEPGEMVDEKMKEQLQQSLQGFVDSLRPAA